MQLAGGPFCSGAARRAQRVSCRLVRSSGRRPSPLEESVDMATWLVSSQKTGAGRPSSPPPAGGHSCCTGAAAALPAGRVRPHRSAPRSQRTPLHAGFFAWFSLAAGGTRRRRMGLPWPFARRGTSAAAEVPGPSGSGGGGALFGRPLAALCSQDGTLPQLIQVSKPGQGVPTPLAPPERWCPQQRDPGWGSGTKPSPPHVAHLQPPLRPAPPQ